MLYNVCGLSCGGCPQFGAECAGCQSLRGKVPWASYTGGDTCPIYRCCAVEKSLPHCGECPQLPCDIWKRLQDPGQTDEQFQQSFEARLRALRSLPDKSDLQSIPGVGKNISQDLIDLGYPTVESLKGQNPEDLYEKHCIRVGRREDRCQLYVFREAVYFAENEERDPQKLKWWNWKD